MEWKKNDIFQVKIEDMSDTGEGIGKVDGFTWFIKDAVIGDVVEVKVMKTKKSYGFARLMQVTEPSPHRVNPQCPVARKCGGCQLQAMSYEEQLRFKENKVLNNLRRIGGFTELVKVDECECDAAPGGGDVGNAGDSIFDGSSVCADEATCAGTAIQVYPIVGMDEPWRYRNKAQFPFGRNKDGKIITGFFAGRTHAIIESEDCLLGVQENQKILACIREHMEEYGIRPYDEESHSGLVRHVLIRKGFKTGELMVCLVLNGAVKALTAADVLVERLVGLFDEAVESVCDVETAGECGAETDGECGAGTDGVRGVASCEKGTRMVSISCSINREKTNVIMGKEIVNLYGPGYITDYIGDVQYRISPLSFYQVNPVQTERLYGTALEYAGLTGNETVWDLYCGIGTISLFLAQKAKKVYGVEIVPQAIEDARANAALNGMENVEFFVGKAEEVLLEQYEKNQVYADVIVVDPPRKGCDSVCLDTIVKMGPKKVVYVSCDSATLARDLKYLCQRRYEVKKVRAVDMFPGSVHVETVCLLSKLNVEHHIEVELEMDELDLTAAESKATYEEIKGYILEHSGLKVSNLYIAQVKQKCGIIERVNYNLPKSENSRQPKCPPEKEAAIRDALEHFRMI